MQWTIYLLRDPRDSRIRYVGWTSKKPAERLRTHVAAATTKTTHVANWISALLRCELIPTIHVVERGTDGDWQARERAWIARCRSIGCDLVNLTDGGEGAHGCQRSIATRLRLQEIGQRAEERIARAARMRRRWARPGERERHSKQTQGSRHALAKLTEADVLSARAEIAVDRYAAKRIAARLGVHPATLRRAARGARWRHVT